MRIEKFVFCILTILSTSLVSAQEDIQLMVEAYRNAIGNDKFQKLEERAPEMVEFLAYYNAKGYYLAEYNENKEVEFLGNALNVQPIYDNLPSPTLENIQSGELNLLGYGFRNTEDKYGYYSIGNSGFMMVILPRNLALEEFNQITP